MNATAARTNATMAITAMPPALDKKDAPVSAGICVGAAVAGTGGVIGTAVGAGGLVIGLGVDEFDGLPAVQTVAHSPDARTHARTHSR